MRELRDRGIYTLPNGMVFVARKISGEYYFLHSPLMDARIKVHHAVDASGRIMMLRAAPLSWHSDDLTDTGRTQETADGSGTNLVAD